MPDEETHPEYEPRFYVELPADWALYMVQKQLAYATDRRCVVDVTSRLEGPWKTLCAGSRVLDDLGWSRDGVITREVGTYTMWVDGLPYTAFRRFVLRPEAA